MASRDKIAHAIERNILSYMGENGLAGRLLDFASGSGASSMVLARLFPSSREIVGVDPEPEHIELARHQARFYGVDHRVAFHLSPNPTSLPGAIGLRVLPVQLGCRNRHRACRRRE
jgi:predicted O-methyltransferase YrrM